MRASIPVSSMPLARATLGALHTRPRGERESTDFSLTRFLVPALGNLAGVGVYCTPMTLPPATTSGTS